VLVCRSRRHAKLNQAAALRASARGGGLSAAGHAGYAGAHGGRGGAVGHANPTGVYQSEAEKLALERRLLTENRRVLELEEELDRQLTREQRMKRQLERLRQEEEMHHHRAGTGVPVNYPVSGPASGYMNGMNGMNVDQRSYDQSVSLANLRSALAVQQAEIEDLQRVKREMREQIGMEREMYVCFRFKVVLSGSPAITVLTGTTVVTAGKTSTLSRLAKCRC
jgi:hypothetical protein